jgi:hypothetical protein
MSALQLLLTLMAGVLLICPLINVLLVGNHLLHSKPPALSTQNQLPITETAASAATILSQGLVLVPFLFYLAILSNE